MCGDWVGTPRRAIPTADARGQPAQRHGPIFLWAALAGASSGERSADLWQTCRV
jgi:hypothetical protein